MARTKLLLDCDPGLDDALALLLARSDPDLELIALTTVGGNVDLASTTRNELALASPNDADWSGQAVHDVCAVAYVAGFWDYVHDAWQLTADGHANG